MRAISNRIGTTEFFECCTQSTTETINCFPKTLNINVIFQMTSGKAPKIHLITTILITTILITTILITTILITNFKIINLKILLQNKIRLEIIVSYQ